MGQHTDSKNYHMRLALDKAKADIINSIEQLMTARNLNMVTFTTTRNEPFSDDDENAFMREVISLDKDGTITYDVPDFGIEDTKHWNDADMCPYSLNWMLSEIEAGNYFMEEDEDIDEN